VYIYIHSVCVYIYAYTYIYICINLAEKWLFSIWVNVYSLCKMNLAVPCRESLEDTKPADIMLKFRRKQPSVVVAGEISKWSTWKNMNYSCVYRYSLFLA
jgi:hypothetical protein